MTYTHKTYIGVAIIFVLSVLLTVLLPMAELFRGIAAMPAVGALVGALYQLARDHAAHERQVELQRKKQFFDLAVTFYATGTFLCDGDVVKLFK